MFAVIKLNYVVLCVALCLMYLDFDGNEGPSLQRNEMKRVFASRLGGYDNVVVLLSVDKGGNFIYLKDPWTQW